MIGENGNTLLLLPYAKRDFKSHHVPEVVYNGGGGMEVCSIRLCMIMARIHRWSDGLSYRIPGMIYPSLAVVLFDLKQAELISKTVHIKDEERNNENGTVLSSNSGQKTSAP